ncbi:hypothetical protein PVK06_009435 [Gossypium arboreum]|uniref:Uncharacterized protein n=1 Tax=Gossypium arboreum TaxID=29729 RepID=A0ABR0QNV8_GOSAR|nr:hypothetical protein PVK06_009435 [Gossypium arboreum]
MSVRCIVREVLPIGKALTRKVVIGRSKGDKSYSIEKPKEETKDNESKRKILKAAKVEALTLSGGWAHGSNASKVNPEMMEHPIQSVSNNKNGNQAIRWIHFDFIKLLKADTTSLKLWSLPLGLA